MVSKQNLLTAINKIRACFTSDEEVGEALDFVQSKVEQLPTSTSESTPVGNYPLEEHLLKLDADYYVFSDGGCRGNPGPGGWGFVIQDAQEKVIVEHKGGQAQTTNNRMEMQGALEALHWLVLHQGAGLKVVISTDSQYLIKGMQEWVPSWKKRGWKKADKKPPENLDLWRQLDEAQARVAKLWFFWVKGHAGHPQNERCDQLVNDFLDESEFS